MLVYKATNKANGKIYVGITRQRLEARMAQHRSDANRKKTPFACAIAKHGFDSFQWEVLESCDDYRSLQEAEIRWIAFFDCLCANKRGYNRTPGGAGNGGLSPSEETKQLLSKVLRQKYFFRDLAFESRQKSLFNPSFGRRLTSEHKENIRLSMLGKRHAAKLSLEDINEAVEMNREGLTHGQIAAKFNVNRATISYALRRAREAA